MTKQQKYPSSLTDEQIEFIKQFLPVSSNFDRPSLEMEQVLNAIFYVVVGGIAWQMLPTDFPNWKSVYHYFWKWRRSGDWTGIYNASRELERLRKRRAPEASAGSLDSQSVKNVGGKHERPGGSANFVG